MERYLNHMCKLLSMILVSMLRKEWKTEEEIKETLNNIFSL